MMLAIVRAMMLAAFIKILLATDRPVTCAGVYAVLGALFGVLLEQDLVACLVFLAARFALSWLYFWLLITLEGNRFWWGILVVGFVAVVCV